MIMVGVAPCHVPYMQTIQWRYAFQAIRLQIVDLAEGERGLWLVGRVQDMGQEVTEVARQV
jgi:hypothetical protein